MKVGDLVVAPSRPGLGVGRLVAVVEDHGRVHFYDDGELLMLELSALASAPPGVWDKTDS